MKNGSRATLSLEQKDREILEDPETTDSAQGAAISSWSMPEMKPWAAWLSFPMGQGVYELSKMAISPRLRGLGNRSQFARNMRLHRPSHRRQVSVFGEQHEVEECGELV